MFVAGMIFGLAMVAIGYLGNQMFQSIEQQREQIRDLRAKVDHLQSLQPKN